MRNPQNAASPRPVSLHLAQLLPLHTPLQKSEKKKKREKEETKEKKRRKKKKKKEDSKAGVLSQWQKLQLL